MPTSLSLSPYLPPSFSLSFSLSLSLSLSLLSLSLFTVIIRKRNSYTIETKFTLF